MRNIVAIQVVGFLAVLLACAGCQRQAGPALAGWTVIDVRTPGEFAAGHLTGAVNMPHDRIADLIGARVPDRSAPVLLYCRSGRRSGLALETLKAGGYTRLTNAGGYDLLARVFGSSR